MEYLLFTGYLILLAWLVTRIPFFTRAGLTKPQLLTLYLVKVIAGIFYGWIGIYFGGQAKMWDTWIYHTNSLYEYNLLLTDPHEYATNLFRNSYEHGFTRFLASSGSYWNDLKGSIFIKLLSVFNIFSRGYYFINVLFYNFLSLFGLLAIFRVFVHVWPARKTALYLSCLLIPSILYWTSGIHKEGLIFAGIAFAVYGMYFSFIQKRFSAGRLLLIFTGILLLLLLRNALVVLLIPALFTWLIAERAGWRVRTAFLICAALFIVAFFTLRYVVPALDLPRSIAEKQQEFLQLGKGKATVSIRTLEPTAAGYLKNLPQAISLSVLRPYPSDVHNLFTLATSAEQLLLLLLFIIFLMRRHPFPAGSYGLLGFCLFFSIAVLLAIGYTNNNIGAIARYRTVVMPLLLIPMLAAIKWPVFNRQEHTN